MRLTTVYMIMCFVKDITFHVMAYCNNKEETTMMTKVLIDCVGFNDMSTIVSHIVSSPRQREKRDRRDHRRDEREGQGERETGMEMKKQ